MNYFLPALLLLCSCTGFCELTDSGIGDLKSGRRKEDTSYAYNLPFTQGKKYLLIQAANSKMSHKNELSYDFKMRQGSPVCAARAGTVTAARSDSDKGGLKQENLSDGNYIILRHSDGSQSYYWHLRKDGVVPKIGDRVEKGQLIGYSGNTGYTAFPHLHFQVVNADGKEILVRFKTQKGLRYLRPAKWYRRV